MARLIIPELEELSFRRKMYENERTMSFLHKTVPFPKEAWEPFYQEMIQADPAEYCYRLIYCGGCEDFVGEVMYRRRPGTDTAECAILIEASKRKNGYGRSGMELLEQTAAGYGIRTFYARIAKDNPACGFFEHLGFRKVREEGSVLVMKKEFTKIL